MVSDWTPPRSALPGRGDRAAHSTLRAWLGISPVRAVAFVLAGLVASWVLTYALGGAAHVVPHWYYVPILFTAVRFGPLAAIVVALIAGVLAGPLTELDVATGAAQEPHRWLTRMGFFVVIGGGMASLVRSSLPTIAEEVRHRRDDLALRRALEGGELFLRYQPIVHVETGSLYGVEALIRWRHPREGEIPPARFLPAAERGAVIHDIGAFVLREACAQARRWAELATSVGHDAPRVAINMSARELEVPEVVDRVRVALDVSGVDPDLICIEVTESTLVSDMERCVERLGALKQLGVRLAVDDFGTGYSSLSAVHRYPVDVLKIDRGFLAALDHDQTTRATLGGVALFARSLRLTTLAEGVETPQQAALLQELGYELAQGYWFGRPATPSAIDRLVTAAHPLGPTEPSDVQPEARGRHSR
jgi:diguanylate cyclase